jgi:hypothetical protein
VSQWKSGPSYCCMYLLPRRRPDTITRLTASAARNGTRGPLAWIAAGCAKGPWIPSAAHGCRPATRYKYCIFIYCTQQICLGTGNLELESLRTKAAIPSRERGLAGGTPKQQFQPRHLAGTTRPRRVHKDRAAAGDGGRTIALPFSGPSRAKGRGASPRILSETPQLCSNTTQAETAAGLTPRRRLLQMYRVDTSTLSPPPTLSQYAPEMTGTPAPSIRLMPKMHKSLLGRPAGASHSRSVRHCCFRRSWRDPTAMTNSIAPPVQPL